MVSVTRRKGPGDNLATMDGLPVVASLATFPMGVPTAPPPVESVKPYPLLSSPPDVVSNPYFGIPNPESVPDDDDFDNAVNEIFGSPEMGGDDPDMEMQWEGRNTDEPTQDDLQLCYMLEKLLGE